VRIQAGGLVHHQQMVILENQAWHHRPMRTDCSQFETQECIRKGRPWEDTLRCGDKPSQEEQDLQT